MLLFILPSWMVFEYYLSIFHILKVEARSMSNVPREHALMLPGNIELIQLLAVTITVLSLEFSQSDRLF